MAKPNYQFDKRQRDLAKKKKQDAKRLKRLSKGDRKDGDAPAEGSETAENAPADPASN